jgi:hypothetical protein
MSHGVASVELCVDLPDDFLVVQSAELADTVKGGNKVQAHQSAGFVVWIGGCHGVWYCQPSKFDRESGKFLAMVVIIKNQREKEGLPAIIDNWLNELPFLLKGLL